MSKIGKAKKSVLKRLGTKGDKVYQNKIFTDLTKEYSAPTVKRALVELIEEEKVIRSTKKGKPVLINNSSWWGRNKGKLVGLALLAVLVTILLFTTNPAWFVWLKSLFVTPA